jgi:uncharacterized membrane protein YhaH (DUF805 family)
MNPKELFSLKGRLARKHFLIAWLVAVALTVVLVLVWNATHTDALKYFRVLIIAAFIPFVVRRLHDMGYSGWLAMGVLLLPVVLLLLLLLPGTPSTNAYGPDPKTPWFDKRSKVGAHDVP